MRTWYDEQQAKTQALEQAEVQRKVEQQAAQDAKARPGFTLRHTPMTERIQTLIDGMPSDERDQERPMSFFLTALRAKYPTRGAGRAHPGEVGTALRSMGWRRVRKWRGETESFAALWAPPAKEEGEK